MLKLAGLILLVILVLVGALLPLKYTARMHLPRKDAARSTGSGRNRDSQED